MKRDIVTSLIAIVVFTVLLGIVYPLAVTGVSQVALPFNSNGQKLYLNGRLVGSKLIGQSFTGNADYFQSRPSATTPPYNAAASTFSNKGPNSVKTREQDEENIKAYLRLNKNPASGTEYDPGLTTAKIPVDAVNTSASGLDPEISPANAWIQAHRVAVLRRLPLAAVDRLIAKYTSGRGLGFSGEEGVNVLSLNFALDRLSGRAG
ncbi:MAG: K(+)-transporting ATPase subunit C [Solirubrobacteraceae bacterium]